MSKKTTSIRRSIIFFSKVTFRDETQKLAYYNTCLNQYYDHIDLKEFLFAFRYNNCSQRAIKERYNHCIATHRMFIRRVKNWTKDDINLFKLTGILPEGLK